MFFTHACVDRESASQPVCRGHCKLLSCGMGALGGGTECCLWEGTGEDGATPVVIGQVTFCMFFTHGVCRQRESATLLVCRGHCKLLSVAWERWEGGRQAVCGSGEAELEAQAAVAASLL